MIVERQRELVGSADELYAWHVRPGAFERLLPPWERVRLIEPHPGVTEGSRARFAIRIGPVTSRWVARHEAVVPGRSFTDVQETGPFVWWRHLHQFEPLGPDRATLLDRVEGRLPGGPLGRVVEPFVARRVGRALRYRHAVTAADLELHGRFTGSPRLTIAITGASGLIGRTLAAVLTTGGHRVVPIVRRPPATGEIQWDPVAGTLNPADLAGIDVVVHLAGESIAGSRWSEAQMEKIRSSRVRGTATIVAAILAASPRPRALVSASAIGFYGDRANETLDEHSRAGSGFLPAVAQAWETAAQAASAGGVRVVAARLGPVLSPAGGMLATILPIFRLGLGGRLGNGKQWMGLVSIDDCAGALVHLILTEVEGAVNVVLPEPVTNADFTRILAKILGRPAIFPAPAAVLRLVFRGLANEGLLASTKVVPRRLPELGYRFRHPSVEAALVHVLGETRE